MWPNKDSMTLDITKGTTKEALRVPQAPASLWSKVYRVPNLADWCTHKLAITTGLTCSKSATIPKLTILGQSPFPQTSKVSLIRGCNDDDTRTIPGEACYASDHFQCFFVKPEGTGSSSPLPKHSDHLTQMSVCFLNTPKVELTLILCLRDNTGLMCVFRLDISDIKR